MQNIETIDTNTTAVSCNGREAPYDHPKIYLKIDSTIKFINCPYCARKFILKG